MADLVRRQHPSLDTMLLQPDGKYQTRTVALDTLMREATDCLAEGFRHRPAEDFPTLYCAWGKCRVGSTPLTNLFGLAGMPSYYQPLKVILRHALVGRPLAALDRSVGGRSAAHLQQGNGRAVCPGRKPVPAAATVARGGLSAAEAALHHARPRSGEFAGVVAGEVVGPHSGKHADPQLCHRHAEHAPRRELCQAARHPGDPLRL